MKAILFYTLHFKVYYVSLLFKNEVMICFPNAKINLGLNIVSKRTDGYHNIETVFYPIALSDALEILPSNDRKAYRLFETGLKTDSKPHSNLVVKALLLLSDEKLIPNLDIHLLKNIPSSAGLGGGSSDAAFMLKMLNQTYSLGLTNDELKQFAVKIGADCPFFINNKPAFASNIGDQLEEINLSLDNYYLVIIKPNIAISTKEAYELVVPTEPEVSLKEIVKMPINKWRELMHNDFETPIFRKHPIIEEIKQQLYSSGALYASMSGSGTSVYGIFEEKPHDSFSDTFPDFFVWKNNM